QSLRQCSRAVQLSHSQFPATAVRLSHRPSRDSRNGWPQRVPTALESWENEMKLRLPLAAAAVAALGTSAAFTVTAQATPNVRGPGARTASAVTASAPTGIHKIKHVIIILQENRTFDSYFGTYPGADGIPSGVCVPDPGNGGCVKPFVDHRDSNKGGPHQDKAFTADVNGGQMDGFIGQAELKCKPNGRCPTDVMGYHVRSDIPNYWKYA